MPPAGEAKKRAAIIVAHGQPSDPGPAEASLRRLAGDVAATLPGWHVGAATLAAPGALASAARACPAETVPLIYPFFMADGWFTRANLPRRLAEAGLGHAPRLDPFGTDAAVLALIVARLTEALTEAGWQAGDTTLILAAHGARRGTGSALASTRVADEVRRAHRFFDLRLGFIEEAPLIADAAWAAGDQALCLPLFVAEGGHVSIDLPAALAEAGFTGRLLPPIGTDPRVPALIGAALSRAAARGDQNEG